MTNNPKQLNLNLVPLVNLACNVLQQGFLKQPRDKAKLLLKNLKGGKRTKVGSLTLDNNARNNNTHSNADTTDAQGGTNEAAPKLEAPLYLALDYSEFRGGFNFPAFEAALSAMLQRVNVQLKQKKDLNLLTNEEAGTVLVHLPGVIQAEDGRYNVLVMAFEIKLPTEIVLKLMFIDPDQYAALAPEDGEVTADGPSADQASTDQPSTDQPSTN